MTESIVNVVDEIMNSKIQTAKELFKNNKYKECKQLLLQLREYGNQNNIFLLSKLGEVSVKLNHYESAIQYFMKIMDINPNTIKPYIKCAAVYYENLNDDIKAQKILKQAMQIHPNNEEILFNYAKLMCKMKNYGMAESCFAKCIVPRACVCYHYASLLVTVSSEKQNKIQSLFYLATRIQPNITKYRWIYANYLRDIKCYDEANKQYLKAMALSKEQDIFIIFDYAQFINESLEDYGAAIKLLQKALSIHNNERINSYYIDLLHKYDIVSEYEISINQQNKSLGVQGAPTNLQRLGVEETIANCGGFSCIASSDLLTVVNCFKNNASEHN